MLVSVRRFQDAEYCSVSVYYFSSNMQSVVYKHWEAIYGFKKLDMISAS